MNPVEQKLKQLASISLSEEKRSHMREEISAYAELHAFNTQTKHSVYSVIFPRLWAVLAIIVLVIGVTGGTAYAANTSMPGDTLYPLKIHVAEPIQTAFIPSPRGKAAWHAILAERRLEEATQLAAKGNLSTEAGDQLAESFNSNVSASLSNAQALETHGDTIGSLDVRSDLEARISANAQILGTVINYQSALTTVMAKATSSPAQTFLALVKDNVDTVSSSRVALEDSIRSKTASSTTTARTERMKFSHPGVAIRARFANDSDAHLRNASAARSQEIDSILAKHATMLAAFAPASTTASTTLTASSSPTSTTTLPGETHIEDKENIEVLESGK